MLPALVIGLREGLETVVVIGAIVVFLRAQGRGDLIPRVWRASALAAVMCVGIGLVIRYVEVNLSWRRQEQFETVVGLVAVATVTYMVVWMKRFPKDLRRATDAAASVALARRSGTGLVLLAFFAVLREGFEITVFVVATIGLTGRNAWLSTGGALLGVLVALLVGIGVVKGTRRLDVARFFRATALVLVLSAAGLALSSVHTANAAGWITFGQRPQFDLSWLAPPGSVLSSFTTGMFGLQPYPTLVEVLVWLGYLVPMTALVLWPTRHRSATGAAPRSLRHRRVVAVGGLVVTVVVFLGVGLAVALPSSPPPKATGTTAKVLFASLQGVSCASVTHCVAVGDFLPVDKDAAVGDPDGDGKASHTLIESAVGTRWTHVASPDEGRGGAELSAVSCADAGDCVAVGFYRQGPFPASAPTAPPSEPLIESESDGRWHIVDGPTVAPDSVLTGVSCPTSSDCTAVGYTVAGESDGNPIESFFLESFDGRSWTLLPTSAPAGTVSGLNAVSCPSSASCVAVGDVAAVADPGVTRPLVETMTDGAWTAAALPPMGTGQGILYGVSCAAAGQCMAAGNVYTGSTTGAALVLSQNGSTWSLDQAALGQGGDPSLTALGCADAGHCVVAGTALESARKVLARVDADGWQALASPSFSDNVQGLACPAVTRCVAVGSAYVNLFGNTEALVASLSADAWITQKAPAL